MQQKRGEKSMIRGVGRNHTLRTANEDGRKFTQKSRCRCEEFSAKRKKKTKRKEGEQKSTTHNQTLLSGFFAFPHFLWCVETSPLPHFFLTSSFSSDKPKQQWNHAKTTTRFWNFVATLLLKKFELPTNASHCNSIQTKTSPQAPRRDSKKLQKHTK
jgi:hypothetical protein